MNFSSSCSCSRPCHGLSEVAVEAREARVESRTMHCIGGMQVNWWERAVRGARGGSTAAGAILSNRRRMVQLHSF